MKDQLKAFVVTLLSAVVVLVLALGGGFAMAEEEEHEHTSSEFEVTLASSPRFPVMGEEAELTFIVSHDGTHAEGLTVMVVFAKAEEDDHHDEAAADDHDEAAADDHDEAAADDHDEAAADDHHDEIESIEVGAAEVMAIETAPGVYVAKYTFNQEGKHQVTAYLGEEQAEFTVSVRSGPVAWPFILGLVGVLVLLAGMVAIIKTVRRKW